MHFQDIITKDSSIAKSMIRTKQDLGSEEGKKKVKLWSTTTVLFIPQKYTWYPTLFPSVSPLSQATLSAIDIATIRRGCKEFSKNNSGLFTASIKVCKDTINTHHENGYLILYFESPKGFKISS